MSEETRQTAHIASARSAPTWHKMIESRTSHFGPWFDPDEAWAKYRHQVDALQAGREPDPMPSDGPLTVLDRVSEFLESKEMLVEIGDLSKSS